METYIVFRDHLYGGYYAVLESEVKAYEEEADGYDSFFGYCDQCYDSDWEIGKLVSDHEPTQNEIDEFVRNNE